MKKIVSISVLFLVISGIMLARGKESKEPAANTSAITGTIIDQRTGELLAGVAVSVEGTDIKAYTDFEGRFAIRGIKPGTYNLSTSIISYEKHTVKDLEVATGLKKEISISLTTEK